MSGPVAFLELVPSGDVARAWAGGIPETEAAKGRDPHR
jgi:hypothetical protein